MLSFQQVSCDGMPKSEVIYYLPYPDNQQDDVTFFLMGLFGIMAETREN